LLKKKFLFIFILTFFLINFTILYANPKSKIINNFNNIDNLKFSFTQVSFNKKENGICFIKRPYFLKCVYEDKNKKELIINRNNLVIYHKKYNKTYFYPVSKSYFVEILDKKLFGDLISNGIISLNEEVFEIKYFKENKGQILFFFNKESFDLAGWKIVDLNGNQTVFQIENLKKNQNLDKKLFQIPQIN